MCGLLKARDRRSDLNSKSSEIEAPDERSRQRPSIIVGSSSVEHQIRLSALKVLQDPQPEHYSHLHELSGRQWQQLARWLDLSGLALYFFDRLRSLSWPDLIPASTYARMQQNLKDNLARTRSLVNESIAIQRGFQELHIRYAVLKGLSLWPSSVPALELRSQLDLDFLVAEESAPAARKILERRGYRLYAVSGRSWEFKRNEKPGTTLRDLYKDLQSWAVELHIEPAESNTSSPLERREWREAYGLRMPMLSPVDLFLGQGLHVYKHVCDEFMRAAHLWEFRRNVLFRRNDVDFWNELQKRASDDPSAAVKLGVVLLLIAEVTGEFAPEALTSWTACIVPAPARFWIKAYGNQAVLGDFPGSKRYLLLQTALGEVGVPPCRNPLKSIFPTRLPPPIIRPLPNETLAIRIARNWAQVKFVVHRFRFHLVAGLDLWRESRRWRTVYAARKSSQ